jgi:hypothetical protein
VSFCETALMRRLVAALLLLCVASVTSSSNGYVLRGGGSSSDGATSTSQTGRLMTINESYVIETAEKAIIVFEGQTEDIDDYDYDTLDVSSSNNQWRRRDQDVEQILNDMSSKTPSQWTGLEWFVMVLFLSFLGWVACCLCTLCCCGGGGGGGGCLSDILGWVCCWEICCRGGRDIEDCCYDLNRC